MMTGEEVVNGGKVTSEWWTEVALGALGDMDS
jgi:hypothetical protein